ncbi:hypothetical protein V6Z11_A06G037300 [Gossypium hirsutum]
MQQPWNGLSPAQVVGAVAFQNRKLAIPPNTSPKLVSLMESCWADICVDYFQEKLFIIKKERTRCGILEVMYLTHYLLMNRIWRW